MKNLILVFTILCFTFLTNNGFARELIVVLGENSKYFHYGITSSDILDTAFSIQLRESAEIIE